MTSSLCHLEADSKRPATHAPDRCPVCDRTTWTCACPTATPSPAQKPDRVVELRSLANQVACAAGLTPGGRAWVLKEASTALLEYAGRLEAGSLTPNDLRTAAHRYTCSRCKKKLINCLCPDDGPRWTEVVHTNRASRLADGIRALTNDEKRELIVMLQVTP